MDEIKKAASTLGKIGGKSRSPKKVSASRKNAKKARAARKENGKVKKADAIIREIVMARDKRCVICGSPDNLQWSHLITRRKYSVRWDTRNSCMMCARCHFRHHRQGPEEYVLWFLRNYGQEEYEALVLRSNTPLSPAERRELVASVVSGGKP